LQGKTVKRDLPMEGKEWLLRRNCSLTPGQLGVAYALMCVFSFGVAAGFMLAGLWHILIFTALEMAAVAAAFLYYARHATDYEHIVLADGNLVIEQVSAGHMRSVKLDTCWLRMHAPERPGELIHLESRGVAVDIGTFATAPHRRALAQELRYAITHT
jgi:uncharacterized membrane protein